jgi:hypothetical protein
VIGAPYAAVVADDGAEMEATLGELTDQVRAAKKRYNDLMDERARAMLRYVEEEGRSERAVSKAAKLAPNSGHVAIQRAVVKRAKQQEQ